MIVYYYVVYLKALDDDEMIEIHLKPFISREEAERFQKKANSYFGERVYHSQIRRTDLSKSEKGLWLR